VCVHISIYEATIQAVHKDALQPVGKWYGYIQGLINGCTGTSQGKVHGGKIIFNYHFLETAMLSI
jgi:hypothetical protein